MIKDLDEARDEINAVDAEMAKLFERRMKAAKEVANYKKDRAIPVFDEQREKLLIKKNSSYIKDPVLRSYYIRFLENTIKISRDYQHHLIEGVKVAYSGVEGAFAQIAASYIFPDGVNISYPDFDSAYEAVASGACECAVLPIENSYAGEVGQVMDLIFNGELSINGMYDLRVSQNLLGVPGSSLADINTIISHPQALSQCDEYIERHGFKTRKTTNTAEAARQVAKKGDIHTAAIASAQTAPLYGLKVLDHDINKSSNNTTRFAVLSRVPNTELKAKDGTFIMMFTVRNQAGALVKALTVIGNYGFNMKVLRSRPMKTKSWKYYFYVEVEGNVSNENGKKMLEELGRQCDKLKIVGHYSNAQTSDDLQQGGVK